MKELKTYNVNGFKSGKYIVEIIEFKGDYEAWIRHEDYGISKLMFGSSKTIETFDSFIALVKANLPEYKMIYADEVED